MKANLNKYPRSADIQKRADYRSRQGMSTQMHDRFRFPTRRPGELNKGEARVLMSLGRKGTDPLSLRGSEREFVADNIGEKFVNFRLMHDQDGKQRRTRMNAFGNWYPDAPARLVGYRTLTNASMLGAYDEKHPPHDLVTSFAILPEDEAAEVVEKVKKDPLYAREFSDRLIRSLVRLQGIDQDSYQMPDPGFDQWHDVGVTHIAVHEGQPGKHREKVIPVRRPKAKSSHKKSK